MFTIMYAQLATTQSRERYPVSITRLNSARDAMNLFFPMKKFLKTRVKCIGSERGKHIKYRLPHLFQGLEFYFFKIMSLTIDSRKC